MSRCCKPSGLTAPYYSPAACPQDAPLAEDTPWVMDPASERIITPANGAPYSSWDRATKTLPNGVVIAAEVAVNQNNGNVLRAGTNTGFRPGPAASSGDANALGVVLGPQGNSYVRWHFTVSVPQPSTSLVLWDVDSDNAQKREEVLFLPPHNHPEQVQLRRVVAPHGATHDLLPRIGHDNGTAPTWMTARATIPPGGGFSQPEQHGWLYWPTVGWGPNDPLTLQFGTFTSTNTSRGSGYDFRGPIYAEPCSLRPRYAELMTCCGDCEPGGEDPTATPWVITPGTDGQEVTKTLPSGLVITGTVVDRNGTGQFAPGTPIGDSHPNAILVTSGGAGAASFTTVEFDTTVRQGPDTVVDIYDVDFVGSGDERITFLQDRYRRDADVNTPLQGAPIQWQAANQHFRSLGGNDRSSRLTFANEQWGGSAGPLRIQFSNNGGSGVMYDLGGTIRSTDCVPGGRQWVDTETGVPLSPDELATMENPR